MDYKKCKDNAHVSPDGKKWIPSRRPGTHEKNHSDDTPSSERSDAQEKSRVFKIFFWLAGIAPLFTWNSILSQSDYWASRFSQEDTNEMGFYFNIGAMSALLLLELVSRSVTWKTQMQAYPKILIS
jgi:hypothetical protein